MPVQSINNRFHLSHPLKNNVTGESHKIELIKFPTHSRRFWLWFDGENSKETPEVTLTQLSNRLRKLLKIMVREI